jgi:alcohol dehydrogenase YqhD (iron-dependent ADH family)
MIQEAYPSFTWLNPTRVVFGLGKLSELISVVNDVSDTSSKVFLVTGRSSLKRRGILPKVMDQIGEERITLFDQVMPFPSPNLVDKATDILQIQTQTTAGCSWRQPKFFNKFLGQLRPDPYVFD